MNNFIKRLKLKFMAWFSLLLLMASPLLSMPFVNWVNRFNMTAVNGGMAFTGNTVGLSKHAGQNNPGTSDAIGAYITTDLSVLPPFVGSYPVSFAPLATTTLSYALNSSSAYLDLPLGSTILYAELIWGGSYGFAGENPYNGGGINFLPNTTNVTLISPQNISYSIAPLLNTTNFEAITPGFAVPPSGNYIRTQDVTAIIAGSGAGRYIVGGIPTTVAAADDTHNAAIWTLAVVYSNPSMITSNLSLFIGAQQATNNVSAAAKAEGFCAPSEGPIQARLFASAIEGDYAKTGDQFLFGPNPVLTPSNPPMVPIGDAVFGTNNLINNFFASQVNTLLPLQTDLATGKLIPISSAMLDTRGSYGMKNFPIMAMAPNNFGRQGLDITAVDISSRLSHNQTVAYSRGTTAGDDYTLIAIGMQIEVNSPLLVLDKKVNTVDSIYGVVGEQATYTLTVNNTGTATAFNPVLKDVLEPGLTLVPGSFKMNGVSQPDPDLVTGFAFADVPVSAQTTFEFMVDINAYPTLHSNYLNSFKVDYDSRPCANPPTDFPQVAQSNQPVINFLPLANPDEGETFQDQALFGATVLTNDVGTGIFVFTFDPISAQGGSVDMSPDGTYIYIPPPGYSGIDTFQYTIEDANHNFSTTTVTITIYPSGGEGTDPVVNDDSGTTLVNTPLNGSSVLENDFGLNLIVIDYSQSTQGGTVVVDPYGTYIYTPPLNFIGQDTFTYTVVDDFGHMLTATVFITVLGEPPFGNNDTYTTTVNTQVSGNVLANDSSTLTSVTLNTPPTHGMAVFSTTQLGVFTYTPDNNFVGDDTFTYTAQDALGQPVTQTVIIHVLPVVPVVANPDFNATNKNVSIINGPTVLSNDTGTNITVVTNAVVPTTQGGTAQVQPNGTYTYNPAPGFIGVDTFQYTIKDINGTPATTTVTIVVLDAVECQTSAQCTEGDNCTVGTCVEGICSYSPKVCEGGDQCHAPVCDIQTGNCVLEVRVDAPCNDPANCLINATCNVDGECVGDDACVAPDTCSDSICDGQGGCVIEGGCLPPAFCDGAEPVGACVQCNDDIHCTEGDNCTVGTCVEGICSYSPKVCEGGDQCHAPVCDIQTGNCVLEVRVDAPCNDPANCLINATCNADGICAGDDACVAPDTCSASACDGQGGCVIEGGCLPPTFCDGAEPEGACVQCNDDIPCAGDLACVDNICTGCTENTDCTAGGPCVVARCNNGQCEYTRSRDGDCGPDGDGGGDRGDAECSAGYIPPPVPVPVPVGPVVTVPVEVPSVLVPVNSPEHSADKAPAMKEESEESSSWSCTASGPNDMWPMLLVLFMLKARTRRRLR